MKSLKSSSPYRQQGAATLMVSLVLMLVMATLTLTTARTSMVDQRLAGNAILAKGAFEAADAGIEYGQAYLNNDTSYSNYTALVWASDPDAENDMDGDDVKALPGTASGNITSGNFSYSSVVEYKRDPDSDYVKVVSTSTHAGTVTATTEQYVRSLSLLNNESGITPPPPLVLDGCLTDVLGGPDIYVGGRDDGIAAGTSQVETGAWGDNDDDDNECLLQGHLDAHGGQPAGELFETGLLWEYYFGDTTREEIQAKADAEVADNVPDSERKYVWVTSTSNYHTSWGSATNPIILIFAPEAQCPKINGGPTYYGVIFVDFPCLGANGWGGTTVYGSVGINGDTSKLTANTAIYDWSSPSNTALTNSLGESFQAGIYQIPGTWKDF